MREYPGLWITLAVLALIFCLLLCPICFDLRWAEDVFTYRCRFLGIPIPESKKEKDLLNTLNTRKQLGVLDGIYGNRFGTGESHLDAFLNKAGLVAAVLRSEVAPVCRLLGRISVKKVRLQYDLAEENPATAAIRFGEVFALWHSLQAYLANILNFEQTQPEVRICSEEGAESRLDFSCTVAVPLYAGIALLFSWSKQLVTVVRERFESRQQAEAINKNRKAGNTHGRK